MTKDHWAQTVNSAKAEEPQGRGKTNIIHNTGVKLVMVLLHGHDDMKPEERVSAKKALR